MRIHDSDLQFEVDAHSLAKRQYNASYDTVPKCRLEDEARWVEVAKLPENPRADIKQETPECNAVPYVDDKGLLQ